MCTICVSEEWHYPGEKVPAKPIRGLCSFRPRRSPSEEWFDKALAMEIVSGRPTSKSRSSVALKARAMYHKKPKRMIMMCLDGSATTMKLISWNVKLKKMMLMIKENESIEFGELQPVVVLHKKKVY